MAKHPFHRSTHGRLGDARHIAKLPDGKHHDGGGLYLQVRGQSRSWLFRIGNTYMGLGPTHTINPDLAREHAQECRQQMRNGINPLEAKKAKLLDAELAKAKNKTFREVALEWLESRSGSWTPRTTHNVGAELKNHVFPHIGDLPIQKLDARNPANRATDQIHKVLEPIWREYPNQSEHVRYTIEAVLDWAIAKEYIAGNNAASMKGPLRTLLAPHKSFYRQKHHPSLPYQEIPKLMAEIRGHWIIRPTGAGRCLICKHPDRAAIEAAYATYQAQGHKPCRPHLKSRALTEQQRQEALARLEAGETLDTIARTYGVHLSTIHRSKDKLPTRDDISLRLISEQFGLWRTTIVAHFEKHLSPDGPERHRPIATYALEFVILNATRKMEGNTIKWADIDWEKKLWICKKHKAKTAKKTDQDHIVPLSDAAMAILTDMRKRQDEKGIKSEYVFPGLKPGKSISETTLNMFTRRMGWKNFTIHGFRSTFGVWAVENSFGKIWGEIDSEMALAHTVGSPVRNAYKGDAKRLEPRRIMMQAWADFCGCTEPAEIIPFRQAK